MKKRNTLAFAIAASLGLSACAAIAPAYHPNLAYKGEDVRDAFRYCQRRLPYDTMGLTTAFDSCMRGQGWQREHPYTIF